MARYLSAALLLILAVGALILAWPDLFGLARAPFVAHIVSFRALAAAGALVIVLALALLAIAIKPLRRFTASLAVVALLFAAVNVAVIANRGWGSPVVTDEAEGDVTVLAWNTLGDAVEPQVLAELATQRGADVIALPETTQEYGAGLAALLEAQGRPMQVFTAAYDQISKARSTTILVSAELGPYAEVAQVGAQLPSIAVAPVDGAGPTFVGVHAVAPLAVYLDEWEADLHDLADLCAEGSVVMAGDFNATLDHFAGLGRDSAQLGGCADAALATDNGAVGTWPTSLPPLAGTAIDHVLATEDWEVRGFVVPDAFDDAGTDHRPVIAQLSPAGG